MYISPNTAKNLQIRNALLPKIYGLPKLHKKNIPLRPIISCIQSPFNLLSKFLKNILSNIAYKNEYYIKDSFHFKQKLKNIQIPEEYILISLDLISLYTNIPISLATKIINKKWNNIKQYTDIPQDEFLKAVELTLNSTYFQYENKFFKQIEGCAMGASISSVIAQIVMEDLEETTLKKLDFHIPFFYRYVDDCITCVPKNKTNEILTKFNSYHKLLQFTLESEENKKNNFLDTTIHNTEKTLKTEWFTKSSWSSRYIHYESCHPIAQKKSVVIGLADRSIILSDPNFRKNAVNKAKNALLLNNYPQKLINKIFKERIHKFYNSTENNKKREKKLNSKYISIPYVNELSENLQKLFKKYDINICHKNFNLLSKNFSKLKAKTPMNKKSNIIYQIPCNNCSGIYIGQTSQYLENRLKSHKYDKKNKTALNNHERTKNHTFNFEKTKILKSENNKKKREFLEMIEIQKNKNSINDKKDVDGLSKNYICLLN